MHIIQIDRITINHAGRVILRDLSWTIGDHDRVGLVGPNGAGKSSLFKALVGELQVDDGAITRMRGVTVGYLPQVVKLTTGRTVIEEAMTLSPDLARVEKELTRINAQLGDPAVYNDANALSRTLERQEQALAKYDELGGPRYASKVRELLARLGFGPEDFDLATETLSGGENKLVTLVRLAMEMPDVLLLDEP